MVGIELNARPVKNKTPDPFISGGIECHPSSALLATATPPPLDFCSSVATGLQARRPIGYNYPMNAVGPTTPRLRCGVVYRAALSAKCGLLEQGLLPGGIRVRKLRCGPPLFNSSLNAASRYD